MEGSPYSGQPNMTLLTTDDNNTEKAIFWRGSNCTTRFNFNDIHIEAVTKQLFALGNTSNNDVFGFDSKLLFLGAEIIAPILTKVYNASLTNKIVISDWKVSKVTPIYKGKGNKEEAGNYRPISLIQYNTIALYCPVNGKFVYSVP